MQVVEDLIVFLNGRTNIRFLPFIHSKDNCEVYYEPIIKMGAIIDHDLDKIYYLPSNYILCRLNLGGNIGNYCIKLKSFNELFDNIIGFNINNDIFSVLDRKVNIQSSDENKYLLSKINYDSFKIINNQRLTDLYMGSGTYSLYMKILRKCKLKNISNLL